MSAPVTTPPDSLRQAAALTALAGAVDAIGFLKLGSLFVGFMSANSTVAATAWVLRNPAQLSLAVVLIGLFVLGAAVAEVAGWAAGARRRLIELSLVAGLLAGALGAERGGRFGFAIGLVALATGALAALTQRLGGATPTSALARLGEGLARAVTARGGPDAWAPHLLLWLGLIAGASAGALTYARFGFTALAAPTLFAVALALGEAGRRGP